MRIVHADLPADVPQHLYQQPNERTMVIHSNHQPAMSEPQMGRESFEHCLTRLRTCFLQNETRSKELARISDENKILKAENKHLRTENRSLKANTIKDSAELAVLKVDKVESKRVVEDLTVKLNKARSRQRHYRREAGELEEMVDGLKAEISESNSKVDDLEDKVGRLESKIGGLEAEASNLKRVNRDIQRRYKGIKHLRSEIVSKFILTLFDSDAPTHLGRLSDSLR